MTITFITMLRYIYIIMCQISRYPVRILVVCWLVLALLDINPLKGIAPWSSTRKRYPWEEEVNPDTIVSANIIDSQRRTLNIEGSPENKFPHELAPTKVKSPKHPGLLSIIKSDLKEYEKITKNNAPFRITNGPNMENLIHLNSNVGIQHTEKNNLSSQEQLKLFHINDVVPNISPTHKKESLPLRKITAGGHLKENSEVQFQSLHRSTGTENSTKHLSDTGSIEKLPLIIHHHMTEVSLSRDLARPDDFLRDFELQCRSHDTSVASLLGLPLCPCVPLNLEFQLHVNMENIMHNVLKELHSELSPDGRYTPPDCKARQQLAIIVPFRDRQEHLSIFLQNIHPFLQSQSFEYRIFVVEQTNAGVFNKALLMNAGFLEARRNWTFDCVIFHDVDMIPEDGRNFYFCLDTPRHVGAYVDKFEYKLPYDGLFGGAIALTPAQFEKVNGFSNKYYGWGGEDDDMYQRILANGMEVTRFPPHIARYKMIPHGRDKGNPLGRKRSMAWELGPDEYMTDGLTSLQYMVLMSTPRQLYTWLLIEPACHLSKKAAHGFSRAAVIRVYFLELKGCRNACESESQCVAVTWHFSTSQCKLHNEVRQPQSAQYYLHFIKNCNK